MQEKTFSTLIRSVGVFLAVASIVAHIYFLYGVNLLSMACSAASFVALLVAIKSRYHVSALIMMLGILAHRSHRFLWLQGYIEAKRETGGPAIGAAADVLTWPFIDFLIIVPTAILAGYAAQRYLLPKLFRKI